jgi:hypothetical protein
MLCRINNNVDYFGIFILPATDEATTKTNNWKSDGKLRLDDPDLYPPPPAAVPPLPAPLPAPGPLPP